MEPNRQRNEKTICGLWSVNIVFPNRTDLILQRQPIAPKSSEPGTPEPLSRCYGQQFVFHENGEMADFYSAPCGNDGQLHQWSGTWKWNEEERILFLQVNKYPEPSGFSTVKPSEAYKKGQEFHVVEMTEQIMKLKSKSPSDQLWEYVH